MKEKKLYIRKLSIIGMIIFIILAILCPILYNIIGSTVLEDGTLDEPFYLVGFMWIFIFSFIVCFISFLISNRKNK